MNDDNQKLIDEQFERLPPFLKKAINFVPWKSKANEIAMLHNLSLEQTAVVERETMLILYGFDDPANFPDNLIREAHIGEDIALDIANEVNEKILNPISEKADELEKKGGASNPVIITPETKKAVIAELSQRVEAAREAGASIKPTAPNLPMIEEGEVAHVVPHVETTMDHEQLTIKPEPIKTEPTAEISETQTVEPLNTGAPFDKAQGEEKKRPEINFPKSGYDDGKDPYREPIA